MAEPSQSEKDEMLTQLLTMAEGVDPEVAMSLLDASGWNMERAVELVFGEGMAPGMGGSTPQAAGAPAMGPAGGFGLGGGEFRQSEAAFVDPLTIDVDDVSRPQRGPSGPPQVPAGAGADGTPIDDADLLDPMDIDRSRHGMGASGEMDAELARAIEQSYRAQTTAGAQANEDDLLQQALALSAQEEKTRSERRERETLRQQQNMELEESMLMDQMREVKEAEDREAMKTAQEESERVAVEEQKKREEDQKVREEAIAQKRKRVQSEPAEGAPERRALVFRVPGGGKLKRAFLGSTKVGEMYDYVDVECEGQEWVGSYRLMSPMPRRLYEDRGKTLEEEGITNQFALVVDPQSA